MKTPTLDMLAAKQRAAEDQILVGSSLPVPEMEKALAFSRVEIDRLLERVREGDLLGEDLPAFELGYRIAAAKIRAAMSATPETVERAELEAHEAEVNRG